jgi:ferritin
MNANVSKLLNEQINKEFYSAYLYLDFANYYAALSYPLQQCHHRSLLPLHFRMANQQ